MARVRPAARVVSSPVVPSRGRRPAHDASGRRGKEGSLRPADLRARLRGVISFAPTPFTEDDRVDLDGLAEVVGALVAMDGPVAVCGAVGEYPSLDLEEYRAVISVAAEATAGRVPLIVGIGHGTRIAATLAEHAARAGAAGILVVPFAFSEPSEDGIVAHFRTLADASGLGLVVFSTSGQVYPLTRLLRLAELDGVVGFKDEWGDTELFTEARRRIGSRWAWINGLAELHAARYAALGAEAFTSGLVNVAPDLTRAVRDGVAEERPEEVERAVAMIAPFAALRSRRPGYSVAVIKEAMALLGRLGGGRVRPPISPLLPDDREELRALLPVLGLAAVA